MLALAIFGQLYKPGRRGGKGGGYQHVALLLGSLRLPLDSPVPQATHQEMPTVRSALYNFMLLQRCVATRVFTLAFALVCVCVCVCVCVVLSLLCVCRVALLVLLSVLTAGPQLYLIYM